MSAIGRFRVPLEIRPRTSVPCAHPGCGRLVSLARAQRYCEAHGSIASRLPTNAAELGYRLPDEDA